MRIIYRTDPAAPRGYVRLEAGADEDVPRPASSGPTVIGDIKPFIEPIHRTVISSRSQLREFERANGVRQCGEMNKLSDYSPPREVNTDPRVKVNLKWE